jgi:uncharacterized membrane protein YkoI
MAEVTTAMSKKSLMAGIVSISALAVLVMGIRTAYAHCGKCLTDAKYFGTELEKSEMTLAKAARAAEKDTKGKAVHATVQRVDGGEGINVEVHVIADGKIMAVLVDGKTGKVAKKKEVSNLEGHAA